MHSEKPSLGNLWKYSLLAIAAACPLNGIAADADEIDILRREIAALQQRLDALERRQEPSPENETSALPMVSMDHRGLKITAQDRNSSIRVRPRIQIDGRWFTEDTDGPSGFFLRRVRPAIQGTAGPVDWRFSPELSGTVRILDAWGDLHLDDHNLLRFGKTKTVIGYERLQGFSHTLFLERGLPSVLTPTRDIGIEWHGRAVQDTVRWTVGCYNGALDDTDLSSNTNLDREAMDYGGRITLSPWSGQQDSSLAGFAFGVAAMFGTENTLINDSDRDRRIRYRTSGRNTFFKYEDGVRIDGDRIRLNMFLSWHNGPFGCLSEYVQSNYNLERGGSRRDVATEAFTVQANWVLTGEAADIKPIQPRRPFDPGNGAWGAFEVGVRYHQLSVGDGAFAGDASTRLARGNASEKASACGVGLNWFLNANLLAGFNYEITQFSGHGGNRPDEKVLLSRFQVDF